MRIYQLIIIFYFPICTAAQTNDLLFSEYIEGSSYNKALEIYNGTGSAVDLSDYRVEIDNSGNDTFHVGLNLKGFLENDDVFVITRPSADSLLVLVADTLTGLVTTFNGDDQIRLLRDSVEIDRIGVAGDVDFGKDVTCIRLGHVKAPSAGEQDPRYNGEWQVFEKNHFDNLGRHTILLSSMNNDLHESADHFTLFPVYPNPFNRQTTIRFYIPAIFSRYITKLKVFNSSGRQVDTILERRLGNGFHVISWDARSLSSGIYFLRLTNKQFAETSRLILIK